MKGMLAGQPGFFDLDERYAALSRTGDPLERLATVVDFEVFRADLDAALARRFSTRAAAWTGPQPARTALSASVNSGDAMSLRQRSKRPVA